MNLKKIANVKNIACLAVVLALGIGITVIYKKNSTTETPKKNESSSSSSAVSQVEPEERETVVLAAKIPELTCSSIDFDGSVVFANSKGGYSFMVGDSIAKEMKIVDDSAAEVVFTVEDGKLALTRAGQPATGFVYEKHMIELKDGRLLFDSSPVEYKATSFSAYKLPNDYIIECTAKGQYRLKDPKGKYTDTCKLKESTGSEIEIKADENGFYSEGVNDGLFYNVYRLGDDILMTSWSNVLYVNGQELVPYGFTDNYTDPEITVSADEVTLEPMSSPVDYGAVCVDNEGISNLTAEMLEYVNDVRVHYDMPPLYGLDELDSASAVRAEELAQKFEHTRPDEKESAYSSALVKAGLTWWRCGENIAKGGTTSREVFDSWMASEEHRAVMLDPNMKYLSLSKFEDGGETYWDLLVFNDSYVPGADNEAE